MSYQSIETLRKYTNLKALRFLGAPLLDMFFQLGSIPVWRVIASVAPSLTSLISGLIFSETKDTFAALKTLAGMESAANRLKVLRIEAKTRSLSTDDLWALVDLKALSFLDVKCRTVVGHQQAQLDTICQLLTALRKLELHTAADSEKPVAPSTLAAFPGSLPSLTSLVLNRQQQAFEDDGDDAMAQEEQEKQALVSAVSALTDLQELTTNYCLRSIAAQKQALQQLKQLTRLHLSYKQAGLPQPAHPAT
jgi:hypothetical protein